MLVDLFIVDLLQLRGGLHALNTPEHCNIAVRQVVVGGVESVRTLSKLSDLLLWNRSVLHFFAVPLCVWLHRPLLEALAQVSHGLLLLFVVTLLSPLVLTPLLVDHLVDAPLTQLDDLIKLELLLELGHLLLV